MGSLLLHYLNVWNSCFAPVLPVQHAHICSINCCIHSFNPKILRGIIIYHFTKGIIAGWYTDITGIPWSWTSPNSKLPVDMISHHLVFHIVANATTPGARHAVHLVAERPSNKRSWQRFDFFRSAITFRLICWSFARCFIRKSSSYGPLVLKKQP